MKKTIPLFLLTLLSCSILAQPSDEKVYLVFLYQYMAYPDSVDYSRDFYITNIRQTLRSRAEMSWGGHIPEREFRHFVLPIRVNNENLDNSREVFYAELKKSVEHLSMKEAILEVNHWCHEKVTYRPSDARTSSPLATLKTAYGRCGEESTFLVAALRSVCIPARQVYTPRWAHTDDNHAWVEAWADGEWFFLGACEPEPILNLAWFNESASRGMLMHTKVFGHYEGSEEVMSQTPCYTEINVTEHYAPVSPITIVVTDEYGHPIDGALVEFKVYNYAEFYTVAEKKTSVDGKVTLTAGNGDMLVWVSKGNKKAFQKVSFGQQQHVVIKLTNQALPTSWDLDIIPPVITATLPTVTDEQQSENTRRLAHEDSIRKAYERTMPVEAWRGNHSIINQFLAEAPNRIMAEKLLQVLSEKDLRDVYLEVLRDNQVVITDTSTNYLRYVLNPRVENEWLTPYKHFFAKAMKQIDSPLKLRDWCVHNITLISDNNPQSLRIQPMSVYREKKADVLGRNIFFVSVARSLGFPARINEVNGKLQYLSQGKWQDVYFEHEDETTIKIASKGTLHLDYKPTTHLDDPKYYTHFTLSKIVEGRTQLLTYDENATWRTTFANGIELDTGDYILTTGTRLASGAVLSRIQTFRIEAEQTTCVDFTLREDNDEIQVVGALNAENIYYDNKEKRTKSLLSTTGRGYYILVFVAPNEEPSNHVLHDISLVSNDLEKWGRKIITLFRNAEEMKRFNFKEFTTLPSTVVWGTDVNGKILTELGQQMKLSSLTFPIVAICDTFNRILYLQQGYTIGIGEHLTRVIKKI